MSNTLPLVSHEQDIALKEAGLRSWAYDYKMSVPEINRPITLALAAMWLREKNISVEVRRHIWNSEYLWVCDVVNRGLYGIYCCWKIQGGICW